jgi:hypothetical protein
LAHPELSNFFHAALEMGFHFLVYDKKFNFKITIFAQNEEGTKLFISLTCLTHLAPPDIIPDPDDAELSLDMSEMSSDSKAESLSGLSIVVVDVVEVVEILLA